MRFRIRQSEERFLVREKFTSPPHRQPIGPPKPWVDQHEWSWPQGTPPADLPAAYAEHIAEAERKSGKTGQQQNPTRHPWRNARRGNATQRSTRRTRGRAHDLRPPAGTTAGRTPPVVPPEAGDRRLADVTVLKNSMLMLA